MIFKVEHNSGAARTAQLILPPLQKAPRGQEAQERLIETPAFMPVGTQATIKGVLPEQVWATQTRMLLCNTYHLMGRPGASCVQEQGGLHRFMNWPGGIITDSGGFQVYSLARLREVDDDGVSFQHHIDGTRLRLEAESALETQKKLGSDIAMVLDECVALPAPRDEVARAVKRTLHWAQRSAIVFRRWQEEETMNKPHATPFPQVFGICQGGTAIDLRAECAQTLTELDFPGYALGGFAVGEEREISAAVIRETLQHLPPEKPRYLMGVGSPEELVQYAGMGVDLFDCVLPTRNARNGQLFTRRGKIMINHARYADDPEPVDPDCTCPCCRSYSKAYLRHLFLAKEILASVLNSLHNLHFFQTLMSEVRVALRENRYEDFCGGFLELQKAGESA